MSQPQIDYFEHPVFHPKRLHLKTEAMEQLREDIHRWLWTGATGGFITGDARVGKTTAIRTLVSNIYTRGKQRVPTFYISMPKRDQRTILSVFRQLCLSANLRLKQNERADHLSDRYVHYLVDQSVAQQCPYIVLIVDEMQRLRPSQFHPFAELYDQLSLFDINLMVVFIGNNQECTSLLTKIERPEYAHIYGRFFTQNATFPGLTSAKQVKHCLQQYDTLCYPKDGPTYTAYFLPQAVDAGWQLASLSNDIWRIFREYQRNYAIPSWGMQYFTAAINTLLVDLLPAQGVDNFNDEMMHECILISGLVPSLVKDK